MDFHLLILFIITLLPAVAMPGPNSAFAVAQSLQHGFKKAILAPVGFAVASAIHVTLVFSGIGLIFSQHPELFFLLKWLGVFYLFWMAYKAYKSSPELFVITRSNIMPVEIFSRAVVVSLTNPKAIMVGTLVFPLFVNETKPFFPQAFSLGIVLMTVTFTVYALYVIFTARLLNIFKRSKSSNKILSSIYAGAGLTLASVNK